MPQEPIIIRVTPTPDPALQTDAVTPVPTVIVQVAATDTDVDSTDTVVPATATATATNDPGDGSFVGPLIGGSRTPLPTFTPRPTDAPPTNTPAFTPTPYPETPVATSLPDLPMLDSDQLGIQLYYNVDIDLWWQFLQRTRPLGVEWVKMQADWSFLQPNSPDEFGVAFSLFESHVQRAHNEGFKVLVSVAKAPAWARTSAVEDGPPSDPQALVNFMNFMLDRMGGQISAIEVWNEPNLQREWNGGLPFNGAGYMQLFDPSYRAIRARYPDMPIITAGLAPTGDSSGSVNDRTFLTQMYSAGLATRGYTNIAIGAHPYGWGNPPDTRCCNPIPDRGWDDQPQFFFLDTIEAYREIMVQNNHAAVQIWSTEFGWPSWAGFGVEPPEVWHSYVSPNQQAQYTLRAFEIGQELDYMGPMFLWNLNFANETLIRNRDEMAGFSLLIPGLAVRPLYDNLAQIARQQQ